MKLRRDAGRYEPGDSPWIRRQQIASVQGPADPAGLARLVGPRQEALGWGLYSPDSTIAYRSLTWSAARPDEDWLARRFAAAVESRQLAGLEDHATGYR
ncbi:MAG: hypothetical protein B7733_04520, partial [Myxococcales bacterium FL481]